MDVYCSTRTKAILLFFKQFDRLEVIDKWPLIGSQVLVTLTSQDVSKATLEAIIQENTPLKKIRP